MWLEMEPNSGEGGQILEYRCTGRSVWSDRREGVDATGMTGRFVSFDGCEGIDGTGVAGQSMRQPVGVMVVGRASSPQPRRPQSPSAPSPFLDCLETLQEAIRVYLKIVSNVRQIRLSRSSVSVKHATRINTGPEITETDASDAALVEPRASTSGSDKAMMKGKKGDLRLALDQITMNNDAASAWWKIPFRPRPEYWTQRRQASSCIWVGQNPAPRALAIRADARLSMAAIGLVHSRRRSSSA
ncbi:hypothetical protein V8F33_010123 [Rhypophila sp. PSN 637]